jgi:hypothetical protein
MMSCLIPQHVQVLCRLGRAQPLLEWHMIGMDYLHKAVADRARSVLDAATVASAFGPDKEQRTPVTCRKNPLESRVQPGVPAAPTSALLDWEPHRCCS